MSGATAGAPAALQSRSVCRATAGAPAALQPRSEDAGSVTLWLLGLCLMLLVAGGLSLDLWRGFSERRALAHLADAAAVAGASAIDTGHFRTHGDVVLDPGAAEALARAHAARAEPPMALRSLTVTADTTTVTVTAAGEVPRTLLGLVAPGSWQVVVQATAQPWAAARDP